MAQLNITQSADKILFTAKTSITLQGGKSYTVISANGITHATPGQWVAHSGRLSLMEEPKGMAVVPPKFAQAYQAQYVLQDVKTGEALVNHPYRLQLPSGKTVAGITNDQGETLCMYSVKPEDVKLQAPHTPKVADQAWHLAGGGSPNIKPDYL